MILDLTATGVCEANATAAVSIQRLFTPYLPPIWGWAVLVWMGKKEYLSAAGRRRQAMRSAGLRTMSTAS